MAITHHVIRSSQLVALFLGVALTIAGCIPPIEEPDSFPDDPHDDWDGDG